MSMAMLNESRERYAVDKSFRRKIYLTAFLFSLFNCIFGYMILYGLVAEQQKLLGTIGVLGEIVMFAAISGLYYISGGFKVFFSITIAVAKVIAHIVEAVAFFIPGIGILLGWFLGLCGGGAVLLYGLELLYAIPFIMMPLLTFCKERFI